MCSSVFRLVCVFVAAAASSTATWAFQLDVNVSHPIAEANTVQRAYLQVELTGDEVAASTRAPVNLAIVLDRSGSMMGDKLEEAKKAAIMALSMLGDQDIVSVVTYHSVVEVLVPATKLTDRDAVVQRIAQIRSDGSTALFGGVSKGASELKKFIDKERVNSLLLLSDGLANIGPQSPEELGELGRSLGRQGISVTTIGLGLDYNEDLMTKLAVRSEGNHFFVEDATRLELAFAKELQDLVSVDAQDVEVTVWFRSGIRPVRVLGREAQITGQSVRARMQQLFAGQSKYLLVEVELPTRPAGSSERIADIRVNYRNMKTGRTGVENAFAGIRYSANKELVKSATNRDVMIATVEQIAAERQELAIALRDAGKLAEAQAELQSNLSYLRSNANSLESDKLRNQADYQARNSELDEENWNRSRKSLKSYQNSIYTQRSLGGEKDPPKKKKEKDKK